MPDLDHAMPIAPASVRWTRRISFALVLLLFFVLIPLLNRAGIVPDYRVNFLGKYLCFCIVALGVDLIWGYTGLLSLCQATFFCLGGYAMAMHLSLPQGGGDVRPEYNNIPQFMFFNNLHELPLFWKPFTSMIFTLLAGVALPMIVASVFGYFILRSRVRGVYFSIITQAVAWGAWLLISRNEMLLGGTNGLTNFSKAFTQDRRWIVGLYLLTVTLILLAYLLCRAITRSRLGRVLIAVRDKETRLYFAGYQPYAFKVFAFAIGAALAAVGGMLYAPQVGIITPQNMDVPTSIEMIILVAVGGRGRLWGAIVGALIVCYAKASLTSDVPAIWPFLLGAVYLAVVLLFPDGMIKLWEQFEEDIAVGRVFRGILRVIPFLAICLFILTEALGLMPVWLETSLYTSQKIGDVSVKYVVLTALLAAAGIWEWLGKSSPMEAPVADESVDTAEAFSAKELQP